MGEILQIRTTDGEQARFKALATELGMKHGETLSVLMGAYESEKAANAVPEMADQIVSFQQYLSQVQRLFTEAAMACGQQKEIAREAVRRELAAKDQIIVDLQSRLKAAEEQAAHAKAAETELAKARTELAEARRTIEALSQIQASMPSPDDAAAQARRIVELETLCEERSRTIDLLRALTVQQVQTPQTQE